MKKAIALISAAVLVFSVAGCANKQPDPNETTGAAAEISESVEETAAVSDPGSEEKESAEATEKEETTPAPSSTAVVVVTGGKEYGIQQPDETSVVELVPTIAPPKPRPTAPERSTKPKPTTTIKQTTTRAAIPTPEGDPEIVYPEIFTVNEGGVSDSVAVIGHSCEYFEERGTFGITVRFDIREYSGTRNSMQVAYNCYDKNGKKLNDKLLICLVPLSGEDKTVNGYLSAIGTTTRVEMVSYY